MNRLRSLVRDLPVGAKLGILLAVIVVAIGVELALSLTTLQRLRVGSALYRQIAAERNAIERVQALQSDLNAYQAAVLVLSQDDSELAGRDQKRREAFGARVTSGFEEAIGATGDERIRLGLESARTTWREFEHATESQVVPALLTGDAPAARALLTGIQARRYGRFIEQVGAAVNQMRMQIDELEVEASAEATRRIELLVAGVAALLAVAVLIAAGTVRAITHPLRALAAAANRVAAGTLPATRIGSGARDELGRLGAVFDEMLGAMRDLLGRSQEAARRLDGAARELLAANRQMAEGAKEQAATLAAVGQDAARMAAALQELSVTAEQVARTASDNATAAEQGANAVVGSTEGLEVIRKASHEVRGALDGVSAASDRIGSIVETLQDVAVETRVLSLNAGIEAARAGQAGRGFAVVADEVRALAERAARSAQQIQDLVPQIAAQMRASQTAVAGNVEAVERGTATGAELARSFEVITHSARGTNDSVDEMTRVIRDQVDSTRRTADAVNAAARVADESLEASTQILALGATVQSVAGDLESLLSRFDVEAAPTRPPAA